MVVFGLLANFARRETQAAAALQAGGGSRMARFLGIGNADPTGRRARRRQRGSAATVGAAKPRPAKARPGPQQPGPRQTAPTGQRPRTTGAPDAPRQVQRVRSNPARPNPDRPVRASTKQPRPNQAGTDQARPNRSPDGRQRRPVQQPNPQPGTHPARPNSRQPRPRWDGA